MSSTELETSRAVPADGAGSRVASSDMPFRVWLYSRDGHDAPVRVDASLPEPADDQLLWADVDFESASELAPLWDKLGIESLVQGLDERQDRPSLIQHDGITQLAVIVFRTDDDLEPMGLHCLVGPNWIVTLHQGELDLVDEFNKPFHGETLLGELDGPTFLSLVLDWQLSGHFKIIESLQGDIDQLDEDLLTKSPDEDKLLERLQGFRRRLRTVRTTLSAHREVLGLLSHPRSDAVVGAHAAGEYQRLEDRLQQAIDAADTAREMIRGSFDIFMTRTSQATNDIMKVLTIVSVLLLPTAALAGIMGMNFEVAVFDWSWMFWVTVGLMFASAAVTLVVAKRRNWL